VGKVKTRNAMRVDSKKNSSCVKQSAHEATTEANTVRSFSHAGEQGKMPESNKRQWTGARSYICSRA